MNFGAVKAEVCVRCLKNWELLIYGLLFTTVAISHPLYLNREGERWVFSSLSEYIWFIKHYINLLKTFGHVIFKFRQMYTFVKIITTSWKYFRKWGRNFLNYIITARCFFRLRQNYSKTPFFYVNTFQETRDRAEKKELLSSLDVAFQMNSFLKYACMSVYRSFCLFKKT